MKSIRFDRPPSVGSREGFVLFYVMGMLSFLALAALVAMSSARLESRTSRNHLESVRALYHAEVGVKLVRIEVEERLDAGETLGEILSDLSVTAPAGIDFEPITEFEEMVSEVLFTFESIGRSGDARAGVVAQYRRRPMLQAGLFGVEYLFTDPDVRIFGYDSRAVTEPTPEDSNGGAAIGSNGEVSLGNHQILDGNILLGETEGGLLADCNGCESFVQVDLGRVDPDPLGLTNGGEMSQEYEYVQMNNSNHEVNGITGTELHLAGDGRREATLHAGDYYLTRLNLQPNTTLTIDDSGGAVRIFLNGTFNAQPNSNLVIESGRPFGFQVFAQADSTVNLQPNNDMVGFIYAPGTELNLQPGNDIRGAFWTNTVYVHGEGNVYLDTSLMERWISNELEIHAWYERHGN